MSHQLVTGHSISELELSAFLDEALAGIGRANEHIVAVVPDDTRSLPMRVVFDALSRNVAPRGGTLTILIALGTHPPMSDGQLARHLGPEWNRRPGVRVVQHAWKDPGALVRVGTIPGQELEEISGGLLAEAVPVRINRLALEADRLLIVNPVFPHEVVGFSGGHKYFFPGISGAEMVDVSHWLGALMTNPKVNGHKNTPVRALIERAAGMIATPRHGIALVMKGSEPVGAFVDDVYAAWSAAADLSAKTNIVWTDRAFHTVISVAPEMYRELWTAGKCMYKLEPIVASGGTLVIYGPHIRELSPTHGAWIEQVGYHTRDYFTMQRERFSDVPRGVLAHSTHVKGIGTYEKGVEKARIDVRLATGISKSLCERVNLGYVDSATICIEELAGREQEGILVVPRAGEMLYRLADGTVPDIDELM